jgi:hypothetical protein
MTGGALALSMRTEGRDGCKDEMHGRFCQLKAASRWRSARNWIRTLSIFSQAFSIHPNLLVDPSNCLSFLDILCLRTISLPRVASHFYSASSRKFG